MDRRQFELALAQTPLLSALDPADREALLPRFRPHGFEEGAPLLRSGDPGRHLGILLSGTAAVQARLDDRAYTLEILEAGALFGEIAFFDLEMPRTADVIATSPGTAALLPFTAYSNLVEARDPAAAILEKAVLDTLCVRFQTTSEKLGELLEGSRKGGFLETFRSFFRFGR